MLERGEHLDRVGQVEHLAEHPEDEAHDESRPCPDRRTRHESDEGEGQAHEDPEGWRERERRADELADVPEVAVAMP